MVLKNEDELRRSYEWVTRMYHLRDRLRAETTGTASLRKAEADSVDAMIRKIQRQIAEYLATHPEPTGQHASDAA